MEISKEERAAEVVELMIGFSDRLLQVQNVTALFRFSTLLMAHFACLGSPDTHLTF